MGTKRNIVIARYNQLGSHQGLSPRSSRLDTQKVQSDPSQLCDMSTTFSWPQQQHALGYSTTTTAQRYPLSKPSSVDYISSSNENWTEWELPKLKGAFGLHLITSLVRAANSSHWIQTANSQSWPVASEQCFKENTQHCTPPDVSPHCIMAWNPICSPNPAGQLHAGKSISSRPCNRPAHNFLWRFSIKEIYGTADEEA